MENSTLSILGRLLGAGLVAGGLVLWSGCDTVPAPEETQPPSVAGLQVMPDTINQSDLSPDQVQDSLAQDTLRIRVEASDPDGSVARVVFVVEPSSSPGRATSRSLPAANPPLYGGGLRLSVPLVDEVYTVRVFAVDDDSLSSNQVTGQFRFVSADTSEAAGDALRMQLNRRPDDS